MTLETIFRQSPFYYVQWQDSHTVDIHLEDDTE